MNDPLFGPAPQSRGALLFADDGAGELMFATADEAAPAIEALLGEDLGLDPAITARVLPWWSDAFAIIIADIPATGDLSVRGPDGELPVLARTRLLRGDGQSMLLVLSGRLPPASDEQHRLLVSGAGSGAERPLRFAAASFDRTVGVLIGQAMAITAAGSQERRNWSPLIRYLQGACAQAVRAELSLPVSGGLALALEGDVGPAPGTATAFVLDGAKLGAMTAHVATDAVTGRTLLLFPEMGARYFLLLDDVLVDVFCPAGATRSQLARSQSAPVLRPSEAELLLDLAGEAGLRLEPRPSDVLPLPNALGWRTADGTSLAVVGGLAVEAGTVLFIASDGREHDLWRLRVRDVAHADEPLLDAVQPIAAFHPEPDARPERLYLVALLPRRLGAAALHVSLANAGDGGGWIRLLDAAATQTKAILQAWLPPPPADDVFLRAVAASVRASAARLPVVVVDERRPPQLDAAPAIAVVVALAAGYGAIERTAHSIRASARRVPMLIVLRSSDIGLDATVAGLAALSEGGGGDIGHLVLAGPVGAPGALTAVFARLVADRVLVVGAGTSIDEDFGVSVAGGGDTSMQPECLLLDAASPPTVAELTRSTGVRLVADVDRRLATLSATLHDFARIAEDKGIAVVKARCAHLATPREAGLEERVDLILLDDRRQVIKRRGHA